jgi:hypothetical protein
MIRRDLESAIAYRERYQSRETTDPHVVSMRQANEDEIGALELELAEATSGDVEITLSGAAYESHSVAVPYLTRILESFQSTFRAAYRETVHDGRLKRGEATLSLSATAAGSFKLLIKTPSAQLDLLASPSVDQAMERIVGLLEAAEHGTSETEAPDWAAHSEDGTVRAMIRLAVSLASADGSTIFRWHGITTDERMVQVRPAAARALAVALAGQAGREIITVTGHLEMGQDQPPRVRVRTTNDDYLARVTPDMLERVKDMLFGEVSATMVVDMRTSPTTGNPEAVIELLDISQL